MNFDKCGLPQLSQVLHLIENNMQVISSFLFERIQLSSNSVEYNDHFQTQVLTFCTALHTESF